MDAMQEALFNALGTILVALIGWLATKVVKFLKELSITEKIGNKRYLVDIAVNAVEQIWNNEDGKTKLMLAKEDALELMNKNGINITAAELNTLVEASVKAMNDAVKSAKIGVVELKEGETNNGNSN